MVVTAALLLRTAITGSYLQYVAGWMRWPLVLTGVVLLVLAVSALVQPEERHADHADHADHPSHPDHTDAHGHHGIPRVAWLLLVPVVTAYAISPPAVNAYLADRRAGEVASPGPDSYGPLPASEVVGLDVREYVWRVQDRDAELPGRTVSLVGFVQPTETGAGWYLTRIAITCCAADAVPYRILVTGVAAPPTDSWVRLTGSFDASAWEGPPADVVITPELVERIGKPRQPYL